MNTHREPLAQKFTRLSRPNEATGCIEWIGQRNKNGYGIVWHGRGKKYLAHRVAYETAKQPIPPGLVIDHLCRNPSCVNPEHLEAVTQRVNVLRGNSISAIRARATECARGHSLTDDNAYLGPNGSRSCRTCRKRYRTSRNKPPRIGERHHCAKLTDAQVEEVRRRRSSGEKGAALAREFGVTESTISGIHHGHSRQSTADGACAAYRAAHDANRLLDELLTSNRKEVT